MRREHIARDGMRMPAWIRRCVHVVGLGCLLTGVLWLLFHHYVRREGDFGPEAHPFEHVWLVAHGCAGLAITWVFGVIWLPHVRRGWQLGRNRTSGVAMAVCLGVLGVTGLGLYYLGNESWRSATSLLHWGLGLFGGVWLPIHIWRGRRSARAGGDLRHRRR